MTKNYISRKRIKPAIDVDEDEERRDKFGRKRVDVIECLLDSSSDEDNETKRLNQNFDSILWLTFAEICHIRLVLAETTLSTRMFKKDKLYSKIIQGDLCFRCQKQINPFFLVPFFRYSVRCYICQQRICKKCSVFNFFPLLSTHLLPVRIQTLIKSSPTSIRTETNIKNDVDVQSKPICYDCAQVFGECTKSFRRFIKVPTISSTFNTTHYV